MKNPFWFNQRGWFFIFNDFSKSVFKPIMRKSTSVSYFNSKVEGETRLLTSYMVKMSPIISKTLKPILIGRRPDRSSGLDRTVGTEDWCDLMGWKTRWLACPVRIWLRIYLTLNIVYMCYLSYISISRRIMILSAYIEFMKENRRSALPDLFYIYYVCVSDFF